MPNQKQTNHNKSSQALVREIQKWHKLCRNFHMQIGATSVPKNLLSDRSMTQQTTGRKCL